jgi:hypothetical protein
MEKADSENLLYIPEKYPPNLDLVKLHLKASSIGIFEEDDDDDYTNDFCACCSKPVNKTKLKSIFRFNLSELDKKLTPIFKVYFSFLKYSILMCLIMFIIHIPSLIFNARGENLHDDEDPTKI